MLGAKPQKAGRGRDPSRAAPPAARLVALFALLSLAPLAVLAFSSVHLASGAVREEADKRIQSTASLAATAIAKEMEGLTTLVSSYAQRPTLVSSIERGSKDHADVRLHLDQLKGALPGIATAFVADASGRLIDIVPPTPSIVGGDFSYRDWYRGVTATGGPYLSEAYRSLAAGRPLVVAAAAQVHSSDGHMVGILVAAYGLETVRNLVDRIASAQQVKLTVTDQRGVVIASPTLQGNRLVSRRGDPLVASALAGRSGTTTIDAPSGPALAAYEPVAGFGWTVTASVSKEEALGAVGRIRSTVFALASFLTVAMLAGLVVLIRSLRARRRADQVLRRYADELSDLYNNAPFGYHSVNSEGFFVAINDTELGWLGYSREELIGKRRLVDLLSPGSAEGFDDVFRSFKERGEARDLEFEMVKKDGTVFPVSISATALKDADGNFVMSRSTVVDITDRRRAEKRMREAKDEAERANAAKSEFLSRMSHELRTPLNAILGFGQLLEMDGLGPDHAESVSHILKAGRHLTSLINEVLDLARIEARRLALSIEPVPANEVIAETLDLIRPLAAARSLMLSAEEAHGEAEHVLADRQRLKQVLLNLVSNAVKYNHEGGTVRVACEMATGDRVRISVSDTGAGIPPEQVERLFMPFERLGADRTATEGTGLGLALSKGLAEAMGGEIGVLSTVGRGSIFWVDLSKAAPIADGVPEELDVGPTQAEPDGSMTVLYIEDNLPNFRLVERVLARRPSVMLLSAMQGSLGLDLARDHRPDLILLDLHLPDIPGQEVLERLRSEPTTSDIPVVVVSADATAGQVERLMASGARAYLTKPIDVRQLLRILDELGAGSVSAGGRAPHGG